MKKIKTTPTIFSFIIVLSMYVFMCVHAGRPTSEVFHFEVFRTGLLSQQWVVQHDFSLSFDALVELSHRHMT